MVFTSARFCKKTSLLTFRYITWSGDPRVNENAGIGMIHVVFVRHHNVIEEKLHRLNPHWSGDRLFSEAHRIVVACLQHITYNEWLPLLLGPIYTRNYDLELIPHGYFKGQLPPSLPNHSRIVIIKNLHAVATRRFFYTFFLCFLSFCLFSIFLSLLFQNATSLWTFGCHKPVIPAVTFLTPLA